MATTLSMGIFWKLGLKGIAMLARIIFIVIFEMALILCKFSRSAL
jgi:hypothetical protein